MDTYRHGEVTGMSDEDLLDTGLTAKPATLSKSPADINTKELDFVVRPNHTTRRTIFPILCRQVHYQQCQ